MTLGVRQTLSSYQDKLLTIETSVSRKLAEKTGTENLGDVCSYIYLSGRMEAAMVRGQFQLGSVFLLTRKLL